MLNNPSRLMYREDGRIVGSYVYFLLCEDEDNIFVKIGFSDNPILRLSDLRTSCAIEPGCMAYVHLQSRKKATSLERDLHKAYKKWRSNGEWFKFKKTEKRAFNDTWKSVFQDHATKCWALWWTKINAKELTAQNKKRKAGYVHFNKKNFDVLNDLRSA